MKIIADSGSTKTSWGIVSDSNEVTQESTIGLNPYYTSAEEIREELNRSFLPAMSESATELFLYGSGCESQEMKDLLAGIFAEYLPHASIIIEGDMLGAARATCMSDPGIVGILGTGSNSCYYDGTEITENVDSLGFIMGDEGSGNHMGRVLIADYLRKNLPQELEQKMDSLFTLTRDDILRKVYKEDRPSRFQAQFARFIFQNRKHPYMSKLIMFSLNRFFEEHITHYSNHKEVPCHLIGSISFYFSDYVRKAAKLHDVRIGKILEDPVAGLTLYHSQL